MLKTKTLIAALGLISQKARGQEPNFVNLECNACLSLGGRQCLLREQFDYSVCCHPDPRKSSFFCFAEADDLLCATKDDLPSPILQNTLCEVEDEPYCPSS